MIITFHFPGLNKQWEDLLYSAVCVCVKNVATYSGCSIYAPTTDKSRTSVSLKDFGIVLVALSDASQLLGVMLSLTSSPWKSHSLSLGQLY